MLIGLFSVQFFVSIFGTSDMNRWTIIALSVVYIVLALVRFARLHEQTRQVIKDGTVTDYAKLDDEPAA